VAEVTIRLGGPRRSPERDASRILKWLARQRIPSHVTNLGTVLEDREALKQAVTVRFELSSDADAFRAAWPDLLAEPVGGVVVYRWVGRTGLPHMRVEAVGTVEQSRAEARRLNRDRGPDHTAEGGEYLAVEARKL
jgi:hypothetical protein